MIAPIRKIPKQKRFNVGMDLKSLIAIAFPNITANKLKQTSNAILKISLYLKSSSLTNLILIVSGVSTVVGILNLAIRNSLP